MLNPVAERRANKDRVGHLRFVVVHRFWVEGTDCRAGEEIVGVWVEVDGQKIQLRLSLALRLLFDFLGRHRWLAQSARQIETAMHSDPFYVRHAANSYASRNLTRRMSRSGIKTYIARLREAIQWALDEAGIDLKASEVLVSERTAGNEVGYKLRRTVRWVHLPLV